MTKSIAWGSRSLSVAGRWMSPSVSSAHVDLRSPWKPTTRQAFMKAVWQQRPVHSVSKLLRQARHRLPWVKMSTFLRSSRLLCLTSFARSNSRRTCSTVRAEMRPHPVSSSKSKSLRACPANLLSHLTNCSKSVHSRVPSALNNAQKSSNRQRRQLASADLGRPARRSPADLGNSHEKKAQTKRSSSCRAAASRLSILRL
mmetsp:Transcript_130415/g.363361  ORF Transcript_130415/g.363361 Transcript_130415/m.363361 type:complete len:200 (+) Transcript_130415:137-736(+)